MSMNSIIRFVLILLIHERQCFAVLKNESVCFINNDSSTNGMWCINELKLCDNALAYDMSVIIKQFQSSSFKMCNQSCLNLKTNSIENNTSEVRKKCNGKSNCSLADIPVPSTLHNGGILTLTFVCNNTDDGVEEDNNTTTRTGNSLLPTSSSVTSTSIPTTKNSTQTTESSIFSTGNNTTTTGTARFPTGDGVEAVNSTTENTRNTNLPTSSYLTSNSIPTTKNNTRTTEISIFSTGNNTTTAGTAGVSTNSSDSGMVTIVVSVVVTIIVVVVVVAFLMYRRGQCKQLLGKFTKKYAKHTPDRTDTYAMSSEANANFTYHFSSDIDVSRSDVDYCEIDKVGQETGVEYNHVDLKKTQVAKDPTYNHIGHLNSSPGNTEQTYNHVGDETFQNTSLFTLQPDTYSHIGAMAKPASEQLAEDSYAHINGVKQYIPEVYDVNQYNCAVFQPNGGPTGHQERVMDSGKENMFNVVRPGTMNGNNEAPVSHSYFIVEKHEKEA